MSTFLALSGVTVACCLLMRIFRPRYGAVRGCSGPALEEALQKASREKASQERVSGAAEREQPENGRPEA